MNKKNIRELKESVPILILVGVFMIGVCFSAIFLTSIMFIAGIPITLFHLPLACLLSIVICFFLSNNSWKRTFRAVCIGLIIIFACGIINNYYPDISWDGNTYHKMMTGFMRYGWNPIYQTVSDFEDQYFPMVTYRPIWLDAYPKGSEIIAACFYRFTGNVEIGKVFNLISIVSSICICTSLLLEAIRIKKWQALVCSAIFTIHPVSVSQAFSYYNDGFLWQMALICISCCLYLLFFEKGMLHRISMYLVFASICIGFNIKFSSLIIFAFPCAGLFFLWASLLLHHRHTKHEYRKVIQGLLFYALSIIFALIICGSTSYVINTIRYHNPLYSIIGEGSNEIIFSQAPAELKQNYIGIIGVFKSLFSDFGPNGEFGIKIPFMFSTASVGASGYDQRIGGWGILFSDLFIIGIIILFVFWIRNHKRKQLLCGVMILFSLLGLIEVIIIPGYWWARYFVAPIYIPACAVIVLFYEYNRMNKSIIPFITGCLVTLCFVNVVPSFSKNIEGFQRYKTTLLEMDSMRAISIRDREPMTVTFTNTFTNEIGYQFFGRLFNLIDNKITNFQYTQDHLEGMKSVYQDYKIYYNKPDHGVWVAEDLVSYVHQVQEMNDIAILISVKDEASNGLTDEMISAMHDLGLQFDILNRYRNSYIAIIQNDKVQYEEVSDEKLEYSGEIGKKNIRIASAGYSVGNSASICVDGVECAVNRRGINIVLLDSRTGGVLDSVSFDTFESGACFHK